MPTWGRGTGAPAPRGEEPNASSPLRRNSGGCTEKGDLAYPGPGPRAFHTQAAPPPAAVGRASPLPRPGSGAGAHPPDPRRGPPGSSPHQARGLGPRALLLPFLFVLHPPPRRWWWRLHAGPPGGASWGGGGTGLGRRRQRRGARGGGACEDSGAAGEGGRTGTGWRETRREGRRWGRGGGSTRPRCVSRPRWRRQP